MQQGGHLTTFTKNVGAKEGRNVLTNGKPRRMLGKRKGQKKKRSKTNGDKKTEMGSLKTGMKN